MLWFQAGSQVMRTSGVGDAGDEEDLALGVLGDGRAHAAAGGRERHGDVYLVAAVVLLADVHRVDEAEVDDVHGDLGVIDLAELVPDGLGIGRAVGQRGGGDGLHGDGLADGVGVLAVEAEEAGRGLDGVAAAEHLVDEDGLVGEERLLVRRWGSA